MVLYPLPIFVVVGGEGWEIRANGMWKGELKKWHMSAVTYRERFWMRESIFFNTLEFKEHWSHWEWRSGCAVLHTDILLGDFSTIKAMVCVRTQSPVMTPLHSELYAFLPAPCFTDHRLIPPYSLPFSLISASFLFTYIKMSTAGHSLRLVIMSHKSYSTTWVGL